MTAVLQVSGVIEVAVSRSSSETDDPVLTELEQSLTALVEELFTESTLYVASTSNNTR